MPRPTACPARRWRAPHPRASPRRRVPPPAASPLPPPPPRPRRRTGRAAHRPRAVARPWGVRADGGSETCSQRPHLLGSVGAVGKSSDLINFLNPMCLRLPGFGSSGFVFRGRGGPGVQWPDLSGHAMPTGPILVEIRARWPRFTTMWARTRGHVRGLWSSSAFPVPPFAGSRDRSSPAEGSPPARPLPVQGLAGHSEAARLAGPGASEAGQGQRRPRGSCFLCRSAARRTPPPSSRTKPAEPLFVDAPLPFVSPEFGPHALTSQECGRIWTTFSRIRAEPGRSRLRSG